jgi:folylpolyglutamate synthase
MTMNHSYEVLFPNVYNVLSNNTKNALRLLATRMRKARPETPAVSPTHQGTAIPNDNHNMRGVPSLVGMREWLQILGHSV